MNLITTRKYLMKFNLDVHLIQIEILFNLYNQILEYPKATNCFRYLKK